MAAKAGIHWGTISRLVHGKHVPSLTEAETVVAATGSTFGRVLTAAEPLSKASEVDFEGGSGGDKFSFPKSD